MLGLSKNIGGVSAKNVGFSPGLENFLLALC